MATKIKRSTAVAFLIGCGYKGVEKYSDERLVMKFQKVSEKIDDETEMEDAAAAKLLDAIRKNPKLVDDIEIIDDSGAGDGKKDKAKDKKADKKAKKAKAKDEEEDDEEEEEEDDEESDEEEDDEEEEEEEEEDDEEEDEPKSKKAKKADKAAKKGDKAEKTKAKGKAAKKAKKEKGEGRDKFGSRIGSQAAAINAVVPASGKKPKTAQKIAEETELNLARVKSHLGWLKIHKKAKETDKGWVAV